MNLMHTDLRGQKGRKPQFEFGPISPRGECMNNHTIWAALIYEGCSVEVPFHARPFSQVNLIATDLIGDSGSHSRPHFSSPKLLTVTFYPFNAEFAK